MIVLITGAAGNLGGLLARHLASRACELRLMYHRTPLASDLLAAADVRPVRADLADPASLKPALAGAGVVVHFAGRLFAPRPETFQHETNTRSCSNEPGVQGIYHSATSRRCRGSAACRDVLDCPPFAS